MKDFRRIMIAFIRTGIFLVACNSGNGDEVEQEIQSETQAENTLSDIIWDGTDEVLIYRYFANTATEYTLINFFQIEQ
ncbi:MAG: hypothetical protein HDR04_03255 [Lachnospiraceae bacterium]|nr:hypothetical protein [Lachnospiraceae bacterium]